MVVLTTFLWVRYDEYDNAAMVMMNHVEAWTHQQFMDVVTKAGNVENYYRAVDFYLSHQPLLLNGAYAQEAGSRVTVFR